VVIKNIVRGTKLLDFMCSYRFYIIIHNAVYIHFENSLKIISLSSALSFVIYSQVQLTNYNKILVV